MSVRKSISSAYFSMTAVVLVASILAMGFLQMYLSMEYFKADKEKTLNDIVTIAAARTYMIDHKDPESLRDENTIKSIQASISLIGQSSGNLVFAANTSGNIIMCSEGELCSHHGFVSEKILQQLASEGSYFELGNLGGVTSHQYYTSGRPLYSDDQRIVGYVFASADAASMGIFVSDMFSSFVLSAGLMLLVASVLSILLTSRLTTPLRRIATAAHKFGAGNFSVRVPVEGDDEVAQLAQTFNNMASSLERIDSSRASFMGNIAHELRTPMTTIKGFIDGMLDGTIPCEMQQHYLSLVSQEVGRLTRLIKNMLDITKLEAGEYTVNATNYDVWETISAVVMSAEQRIEENKINIQGFVPNKTNKALVYADSDLIYQVVYNIFDNAIKFTPQNGTISLNVSKQSGWVQVDILNTGDGIAQEALPFVFDRFYKEDESRGLNAKGSGLGLHICKVLVHLCGGKIWVESKQGNWCKFSFMLPASNSEQQKNRKL